MRCIRHLQIRRGSPDNLNIIMQKEILKTIDEYEGGLTNDVADKGGETKYGIAKKYYPDVDIASLTKDQAVAIYGKDYWTPLRLDEVKSLRIRWKVFDLGVNCGIGTSAKFLQRAVQVPDDGIIGTVTLQRLNNWTLPACGENEILNKLVDQQVSHYCNIVRKDPDQLIFLLGWIKRAQDRGANLT
jgi:lysozyme family protein